MEPGWKTLRTSRVSQHEGEQRHGRLGRAHQPLVAVGRRKRRPTRRAAIASP